MCNFGGKNTASHRIIFPVGSFERMVFRFGENQLATLCYQLDVSVSDLFVKMSDSETVMKKSRNTGHVIAEWTGFFCRTIVSFSVRSFAVVLGICTFYNYVYNRIVNII